MSQTFKILQLFWCEKTKSVYIVDFFGHLFIAWQTFSKLKNFPVKYLQVFFLSRNIKVLENFGREVKLDVFAAQMSDPHPGVLMVEKAQKRFSTI